MSPNGLMGSRAALSINQPTGANFSDWLASVPDWAQTSEGQSFMGSVFGPPGAPPQMATPQTGGARERQGPRVPGCAAGFQAGGMVPVRAAGRSIRPGSRTSARSRRRRPVVAPEPKKEDLDPNRPGFFNGIELGDVTDWNSWMAANPHLSTSFEITDKGPIGTPGNSWYHKKGDPR
jgi:hypothetical protein